MTLLVMDGFDVGDITLRGYTQLPGYSLTTTTRFSYGRACAMNSGLFKISFTASSKVICGFAVDVTGGAGQFWMYGDSGATAHIEVAWGTDGSLVASRAGTALTGGTLPAGTLAAGWNYIEVAGVVSDTVGVIEVRLNGSSTSAINITGADTKSGGTATTIDAVGFIRSSGTVSIDDLYIANDSGSANNTFLGDNRIYTLAPDGNGNYSQLVGSDADSTNNYQLVDEIPYSTTDYVGSPTSGNRDSYTLTDLPANVSTVRAVQEVAIAAKTDAGAQSLKQTVRISSTDYETAATALSTSYSTLRNLRETNPNTTSAWTASDVNGMEIGVRLG